MQSIKGWLLGLRLYFFNTIINKIPIISLRLWLMRRYINIGKHSNILLNVQLLNTTTDKSQVTIGNNCVINSRSILDGRVGKLIIGNNVDIAMETIIFTLEHDPHSDYHEDRHGNVIIEDYVWIASRVTILPGVTIGRGAVIASNSVVTKDVESMAVVAGIPAKKISERRSGLLYTLNYFPPFK